MKIPASEHRWTVYCTDAGKELFLTTSDANRTWYYLYDISGPEPVRLGKEHTPILLEQKYKVIEQLSAPPRKKGRKRKRA